MKKIMSNNFSIFFEREINFEYIDKKYFYEKIIDCEYNLRNGNYISFQKDIRDIFKNFLIDMLIKCSFNKDDILKRDYNDLTRLCKDACSPNSNIINAMEKLRLAQNDNYLSLDSIDDSLKIECVEMLKCLQKILFYFFKKIYDINLFSNNFSLDVYSIVKSENIISNDDKNKLNEHSINVIDDISVDKIPIFQFIFGAKKKIFTIPIYQRGYDWGEENIDNLCNDILNRSIDKHSHYFGVIAVKKEKNEYDEKAINVKLLDGQQRITSILILIMAIKSYISEEFGKDEIEKFKMFSNIDHYICKNSFNSLGDIIKNPGCTDESNIEFLNILCGSNNINSNGSYLKNFKYIKRFLKSKLSNNKDDLLNFVASLEERIMVAIIDFAPECISSKKELEVFENLNSKGKSLACVDLIKNYLFNLCDNDTLEKHERDIVDLFNSNIFSSFDNNAKKLKTFFEHFIMYFLGKEIKDKNEITIFKKFKDVINNILEYELDLIEIKEKKGLNLISFEKVIKFISKYISKYRGLEENIPSYFEEFKIKPLILSIHPAKKSPLHFVSFLIMDLFGENKKFSSKEKNEISQLYILAIEFLTMNALFKSQGDSSIKRIICLSMHETRKKFYISRDCLRMKDILIFVQNSFKSNNKINLDSFREQLETKKIEKGWYVSTSLILMEYHKSNYLVNNSSNMEFKSITLEHILPQDISEWKDDIIKWNIEFINDISSINLDTYNSNYLNMIGNFLVLDKVKNSSIKNKNFLNKLDKYNKSNISIWKIYDSQENDLDVKRKEKWTYMDIEKRTRYINDYLLDKIFKKFW